jgi:nitrile hydratase accessory protein
LFRPDDPLAPPQKAFDEPWQAQALALAETCVEAGRFSAVQWAEALGMQLDQAKATGLPDTLDTYYRCVIAALEKLAPLHLGITPEEISQRRAEWEQAYRRTPHGRPVEL